MKPKSDYEKFQDQIFDQIDELQHLSNKENVRQLVEAANARGFSTSVLVDMLNSGITVPEFVNKVLGDSNPEIKRKFLG